MYIDVGGHGSRHTLVGSEGGCDYCGISLGAAHQKVDAGIFLLTKLPDDRGSLLTIGVFPVSRSLLQVCLHQFV